MPDVRSRLVMTCAILATVAVATGSCGTTHRPAPPTGATRITVSVDQCGTGWSRPTPGQQHFVLADTDTRAGEVLLTDAASGAVYADVEPVAPGTTTDLAIALGSGRYAFRCAMEDEATVVGPTVTVPGTVPRPAAPIPPVTQADLIGATRAYQKYVRDQIPELVRLTAVLAEAINRGDLADARRAWLPAHLRYERLGAAYDAFGDLDAEINGLPNGLPAGVHDPDWAGFHRIEYGLWHAAPAASLRAPAAALLTAVRGLGAAFAAAQIAPLDLSIRAHEITENALQFELTGQGDFGSHTNLDTVRANLDGTATALTIIRPLLTGRDRALGSLTAALTRATEDLDALAGPGGEPPLATLATRDRERVNADVSELTEQLAPVASILEPRREA
ncbi:MAG: imelysin family protein [Frankia sp.]